VVVQLAFASLAVLGKVALRTMAPQGLALVRIGGAALIFFAISRARGPWPRFSRPELGRLVVCSLLGVAGNQLLFLAGLSRTTAINASVLTATIPVLTVGVGLVLGREKVRASLLAGIVLALAGVLWLVGIEGFRLGWSTVAGDVMILTNCLMYAIYLVIVRDMVGKHGAVPIVAVTFLIGAIAAAPFGAAPLVTAATRFTAASVALLAYLVLVPTVFTYLANAWALRFARSSVVAIYIYLQPLATAGLAAWLLAERPSGRALVAAVAVFAGIALVTRPWARDATA
jgi:drug/metabolite transporter (DMT)-like permease